MHVRRCAFVFTLFGIAAIAWGPGLRSEAPATLTRDRENVTRMLPDLHLLEPLWSSPIVYRESLLPIQANDAGPAVGRLAFRVAELQSVKTANGERTFEVGRDFQIGEDERTLLFFPEAKITFVKESELYPAAGAANSYKHRVGHPDQNMLFFQGHWFHDRQIEVTYRRQPCDWPAPIPKLATKGLPRTLAFLRAGKPLTIGVSGDSITQGYNASGFTKAAPLMPPYPDLVAAQLQDSYKSELELRNRAISGWSIVNGLADLEKLLAEKPQLLIVAYGMNDVGRRDPEWFKEQVQTFIDRVHQADPQIEIILVAPMLGNAEWIHTPREMFPKYRDALASLTGPGVALADLTTVWETLLKSKHDLDLNGNGLNHPNDFGHRLYAQAILSLLLPAIEPR